MKYQPFLSIFIFLLVSIPGVLFAERPPMEITPLAGYHLGGSADLYQGDLDIRDSVTYGIMYSLILPEPGVSVDFSYTRADSNADFKADPAYIPTYSDTDFGMASNYIMIGASKEFFQDRIRLFIGGDLGTAWFDSKDSSIDDAWFFAFDIKGGMKVYLGERLGLRLQGRFLMPMDLSNSGFFFGVGSGGSSGGISLGGTVFAYQGDFSLGLIVRL